MIKKVGDKWCLFSKKTKKKLYCHKDKKKVILREKQIVYFKNKMGV